MSDGATRNAPIPEPEASVPVSRLRDLAEEWETAADPHDGTWDFREGHAQGVEACAADARRLIAEAERGPT